MWTFRILLCAAAALASWTAQAQQAFPTKPVRIIVPFPPGGTSDILSRLIGPKLTEKWGQSVIVESRPGAAGAIGHELVAKAPPDGYTLVLSDVGPLVIVPVLYPKTPYGVQDFAPITIISYSPHLLCVHPNVPVSTVPQLIALAKKRPGVLNYASSPAGAPYLAGLQFAYRTGIKWEYITGRGGAQSIMDVMTGQADVLFNGMLATLPPVKAGKLKLIAVSGEKRHASLPDTPAVAEYLPGFLTGSWQAILAPARTPSDVVATLNTEVARILFTPDMKQRLQAQGADPIGTPAAESARFLRDELGRFTKLAKETGYKPQ
ncbi:MAG TPA: tripartite tricarboxylate transporter substrate binding protein [Burkholderiales bacterium]|nr:tripartite tricarboxylate transporter substrate binding protein [Burkholderiales bacterium]